MDAWVIAGSVAGVIGAIGAVLAFVQTRLRGTSADRTAEGEAGSIVFFLSDKTGTPRNDVFILLCDRAKREPDSDGLLAIPKRYVGTLISIRDRQSKREIKSFIAENNGVNPKRIILK